MNIVDDITLIRKFVQGKTELLFNQNLRIETACKKIILMTKDGSMLANVDETSNFQSFLVNRKSYYWELINKVLLEHYLMPINSTNNGWTQYRYCPIPDRYKMHFTQAKDLWRIWRNYQYQQVKKGLHFSSPQFLVVNCKSWHKIQTIEFSQENVYINTAVDEMMLHLSDYLVWLSNQEQVSKQEITRDGDDTVIQTMLQKPTKNQISTTKSTVVTTAQQMDNNILGDKPISLPKKEINHSNLNIRLDEGKIYIHTPEGEVVVEGEKLRFWFTPYSLKKSSIY